MNVLSSFNFECQRCGSCCCGHPVGIPLYITDALRLSRHLGLPMEQFLSKFCCLHQVGDIENRVPVLFLQQKHGMCPFLHKTTCVVHDYKPYLCRAAPVVSVLFEKSTMMRAFMKNCQGYGKGKTISESEIRVILQKEREMEIADKTAYHNGWYTQLLFIFKKEVSNDPRPRTPSAKGLQEQFRFLGKLRTRLHNPEGNMG